MDEEDEEPEGHRTTWTQVTLLSLISLQFFIIVLLQGNKAFAALRFDHLWDVTFKASIIPAFLYFLGLNLDLDIVRSESF